MSSLLLLLLFYFRELEEEEVSLKEALSEGRKGLLKTVKEATDSFKVFQGRQVRFVSYCILLGSSM